MRRVMLTAFAGLMVALAAGAALAAPANRPAPRCLKAEINPVTGHVLCLDPLGAPVEPPSPEANLPCKPEKSRGQWSYTPACTPQPEM
jgi:hypothetical protein